MIAETEKAVELFVRCEDAERFLDEIQADDPKLAELLRLEPVTLRRLAADHTRCSVRARPSTVPRSPKATGDATYNATDVSESPCYVCSHFRAKHASC